MTINLADNSPRISYTVAQGVSQSAFAVPFEFFADADLNVYVDGTLKTLTTHYTTADDSGNTQAHTSGTTGYIHFSSAVVGATGGSTVVITRSIDLERTTDFPTSGPFDVTALNTELDKFIAIQGDLKDKLDRSLQLTDFDAAVSLTLPNVDTRKGKLLAFNATTGAVEAGASATGTTTVAALASDIETLADIEDGTVATDAISSLAAISSNVTTVAGISANVTTVASQTTNLQNVTDNLSAIQNAASNATAAETAKTAAEAAQAAAELAADNFDDTYLGAKASDPSVDNDGDALTAGDLYFNTTTDELKYYTGSAWTAIAPGISNVVEDTTPQLGGNLDVQTHSIVSTSNRDINITPNGTGNVSLGNFTFNVDQSVGSGQDNYLLTYDHSTTSIGLEAAPAGGAGYFQGENGATGDTTNGLGDIFRVHEAQLDTNVTIASGNNALCAGPLTVATGVTVTVNGNMVIA